MEEQHFVLSFARWGTFFEKLNSHFTQSFTFHISLFQNCKVSLHISQITFLISHFLHTWIIFSASYLQFWNSHFEVWNVKCDLWSEKWESHFMFHISNFTFTSISCILLFISWSVKWDLWFVKWEMRITFHISQMTNVICETNMKREFKFSKNVPQHTLFVSGPKAWSIATLDEYLSTSWSSSVALFASHTYDLHCLHSCDKQIELFFGIWHISVIFFATWRRA